MVILPWRAFRRLAERAQGPRYELTVESSNGRCTGFTLEPTTPSYEGLRVNFGEAKLDADRLLAMRLARMIVGTPSSVAWATMYDH